MQRRKKGQSALEFTTLFGFAVLIFSAFYVVFLNEQFKAVEKEVNLFAKSISDQVAFELNLAWLQGGHFAKNFTIPSTIASTAYTVNVTNNLVFVEWKDRSIVSRTVAPIVGTIAPGENRVRNNGTILLIN